MPLVRKMIAADEEYPIAGSDREKKNYKRRVSQAAFRALLAEEVQKQHQDLTRIEFKSRVNAANISSFMEKIKQRAKEFLKSGVSEASEMIDAALCDADDFAEPDIEEPYEEDLQEIAVGMSVAEVTRETDEPGDVTIHDEAADDIPYDVAAKTFMEVLLSNTLNTYANRANNPVHCSLCEEDDTIDEKQKVC